MRSRRIRCARVPLQPGEHDRVRSLPFCVHGRPAACVRRWSGRGRKRQWTSDTMEQERGENVLGCGFRQQIRTPRARYTPSGLKFQRDGPPTAADHEIGPLSAISAPFGLKLRGTHALAQPQGAGDRGGGPGALTYWAVPPRPLVCMVQARLLFAQQRDGGEPTCHGEEWWTYLCAAEESWGRRWNASGVVASREWVWVVMTSEQEAHGGGRSGQQPNGKCPSPRVRRTL
jgi:hypothetical protein